MTELRDVIAAAIRDELDEQGVRYDLGDEDSLARLAFNTGEVADLRKLADRIAALPALKVGKPLNLGHSISTGTRRAEDAGQGAGGRSEGDDGIEI